MGTHVAVLCVDGALSTPRNAQDGNHQHATTYGKQRLHTNGRITRIAVAAAAADAAAMSDATTSANLCRYSI